jgi:hypothetical protein
MRSKLGLACRTYLICCGPVAITDIVVTLLPSFITAAFLQRSRELRPRARLVTVVSMLEVAGGARVIGTPSQG